MYKRQHDIRRARAVRNNVSDRSVPASVLSTGKRPHHTTGSTVSSHHSKGVSNGVSGSKRHAASYDRFSDAPNESVPHGHHSRGNATQQSRKDANSMYQCLPQHIAQSLSMEREGRAGSKGRDAMDAPRRKTWQEPSGMLYMTSCSERGTLSATIADSGAYGNACQVLSPVSPPKHLRPYGLLWLSIVWACRALR